MDDQLLFGKKVRAVREAANISRELAAEKAGITVSYLGEVERGEKWPSIEILRSIATATEVFWPAAPSGQLAEGKCFPDFSRCSNPFCNRSCRSIEPHSTNILLSYYGVSCSLLRNCAPRPIPDPPAS